ncbi:MAG: hypothetical protein CM15mP80_07050 [Alphaproteobacteria bacterium]|nr:MAG: hypothetical protein CM15mP80_07050 [Alphaproteobacteria bacterium]
MDASRTGKRLAGKTALIITAVQGIGTASVLAMVKKISPVISGIYGKCLNNKAGAHN